MCVWGSCGLTLYLSRSACTPAGITAGTMELPGWLALHAAHESGRASGWEADFRFTIPKGLPRSAQGWRGQRLPWVGRIKNLLNPNGVASPPRRGCNPSVMAGFAAAHG